VRCKSARETRQRKARHEVVRWGEAWSGLAEFGNRDRVRTIGGREMSSQFISATLLCRRC
jgi:hypothetical protein